MITVIQFVGITVVIVGDDSPPRLLTVVVIDW